MADSKIEELIGNFLQAELRKARLSLTKAGSRPLPEPVHEVRKSIKKLRAVLRLARGMGNKASLAEVANPLREAAHRLGPLRDHLVLTETGRRLRKRADAEPEPPAAPDAPPLLRGARIQLLHANTALRPLLKGGFDHAKFPSGLRRLYKRTRGAMRQAAKTGSDADLHAWRRRAKDLLYALDVI